MSETVTYSDIRFGKRKKLKSSQPRSPGSSVLQEDRQITYAAIRVQEASEEKINLESPRTETRQKAQQPLSFSWFCAAVFLLILDLLLLTLSMTLGVLYYKCQNDAQETLAQTRLDLQDAQKKLQKWELLRGRTECCLEEWRLWKGKCFFVSKEAKNWSSSQRACGSLSSQLASLENPTDLKSINISSPDSHWVNMRRTEEKWIWANDTKSRNPKADLSSNCVVLARNAKYPVNCDEQHRWICEKSAVELHFEQDYNLIMVTINGIKYTEVTKVNNRV
uniref:Natural killer cells antigen CD94-like n=1 Tax=Geotrypetes seraphini TaxID=260995 RepID=A0A6P8SBW6_GEOSA|nr:natural killer cells antigen CD94-like [Geotrypetes seraphini]